MASKQKESQATPAPQDAETIRGTRSTARLSIWIAVAIICVALIGYLTSRSSFSDKDVATGIAAFSRDIASYFAVGGYEGEFSYGSLTLEGSIFARKAVVQAPVFVLRRVDTGEEVRVSAEYLTLVPAGAAMERFALTVETPLVVNKGDAEYRLIPQTPTRISVERKNSKDGKSIEYSSDYSDDSNFIIQVDGYNQEEADASYLVRLGAGSALKGVLDLAEKSYYEEANLSGASVEYAQNILKADILHAVYEAAGHDDSRFHHYNVDSSGVRLTGPYEALGVLSAAFEIEEEEPLATPAEDRLVEISHLVVTGEDFSLTGEGKLEVGEDDLLPYGSLNTQITAMNALLARLGKAGIIPQHAAPMVKAALEKAATPTEDADVLALNFQRSPGGAFMIGDSTFEELTLSLLRDFMKAPPAATASEEASPAETLEDTVEPTGDALQEAEETLKKLRENVVPEAVEETAAKENAVPAEEKPADPVPLAK